MDDDFQQQALGRSNAACATLFAILDRFHEDRALAILLDAHIEGAKNGLLNTMTSDVAIAEFDRTMEEMRKRLPKIGQQT